MPNVTVPAYIDRADIRQKDKEEFLILHVYTSIFVAMKEGQPLLAELEASLGEKINFKDEAQLAELKGKNIRVHLTEPRERSDIFGERVVIDDFRPIRPVDA